MKVVIPAPETPPRINKGGSQHQLEAMNAESSAPRLANPPAPSWDAAVGLAGSFVAHGDVLLVVAQQSAAAASGKGSSAIVRVPLSLPH